MSPPRWEPAEGGSCLYAAGPNPETPYVVAAIRTIDGNGQRILIANSTDKTETHDVTAEDLTEAP